MNRTCRGAVLLLPLLFALLSACSSSDVTSVSGTVYAPNGTDPVPGAEVYIPATGGAALAAVPLSAGGADLFGDTATALIKTVTDSEGRFTLSGVPTGTVPVVISSGFYQKRLDVETEMGETALPSALTALPASATSPTTRSARFAVVGGDWDQMEDVLAKFGLGEADILGALVLGTEQFQIYQTGAPHQTTVWLSGDSGLEPYLLYESWPESYPLVGELFADLATMQQYDVIVINCGADDLEPVNPVLMDPLVQGRIRDFVQQGGRLYVTDRSYDWIERAFPNYISFQNGGDLPSSTPEPLDAAEVGYDWKYDYNQGTLVDFTTEGTLLDPDLSAWLGGMGALNPDGTIHLQSFWFGWSVMVGPHSPDGTGGNQCKVWVEGPVMWYTDRVTYDLASLEGGVRPLTVSFHFGLGKVIYTSYHTDADPHPGFAPQERILEYLLFESTR